MVSPGSRLVLAIFNCRSWSLKGEILARVAGDVSSLGFASQLTKYCSDNHFIFNLHASTSYVVLQLLQSEMIIIMSDDNFKDRNDGHQVRGDKPYYKVVNSDGRKRPPSPIPLMNNIPIDVSVNHRRDDNKHARVDVSSPSSSRHYHIPEENLIFCPVVHIPRNNAHTPIMHESASRAKAPAQGGNGIGTESSSGHKNERTHVMLEPHPRDVKETEGLTERNIVKNAFKCKYPRRGAISLVHDGIDETEECTKHCCEPAAVICETHPRHANVPIQYCVDETVTPAADPLRMITLTGIPSMISANERHTISANDVKFFLSRIDWENI